MYDTSGKPYYKVLAEKSFAKITSSIMKITAQSSLVIEKEGQVVYPISNARLVQPHFKSQWGTQDSSSYSLMNG